MDTRRFRSRALLAMVRASGNGVAVVLAGLFVAVAVLGFTSLAARPTEVVLAEGLTPTPTPWPSDYEAGDTGATRDYGQSQDTGDPISAGNGAYHFRMPLLPRSGPLDLGFELIYRSDSNWFGPAPGWRFWYYPLTSISNRPRLIGDKTYVSAILPEGDRVSFQQVGGEWTLVGPQVDVGGFVYTDNGSRVRYVLKESANFWYLLDPVSARVFIYQKVYEFSPRTRIERILDRNGNELQFSYETGNSTRPIEIADGLGRSLTLSYEFAYGDRPLKIEDQAGRRVTLTYESAADTNNLTDLRSVTDPLSQTTTFRYQPGVFWQGQIASQTLPRGNVPITQTYADLTFNGNNFTRVTAQTDAFGNVTTLRYNPSANVVTERRPDGRALAYEHFSSHSQPRAITDTTGLVAAFAKNADEQLTKVTDRLGDVTGFAYDPASGMLARVTNARGGVTAYTYAAQEQSFINPISPLEVITFTFYSLIRTDHPDGTSEQFTYDSRGNVLTRVDRAGNTWRYTYNARGQVLTVVNPAGGVTTRSYNDDGTLASVVDSDTGITTYTYDVYQRVSGVTYPDGSSVQYTYDRRDRLTSFIDGRGNTTTYRYDANGNLVAITDPLGNVTTHSYDLMDRLAQVTDRLGNTTRYAYDALGRTAAITDATGLATRLGYDPRGWLDQATRGGQTWQTGYDAEGLPASRTTALGQLSTTKRDQLGYTTGSTNPLGQTTAITRDASSRVTAIGNPLGQTTHYAYDGAGRLISGTLPLGGAASYQRDPLGNLARIADLNGATWVFTRTVMGRVREAADPLGRVTRHTYDSRGRPSQTSFAGGVTVTHTYDAAGNWTRSRYSDATEIQFAYDALNRTTGTTGLQLVRDAEGRVTATADGDVAFGATYDAAGRLATARYRDGAFVVSYTYHPATGLLTRVADTLTGGWVELDYDGDFRLVGLRRSNGVDGTFGYDAAGRLTRIQEGSFLDLPYTLDAAGRVASLMMLAPLDPADLLANAARSFTVDAASQISSAGYAYDARGRLTAAPGATFTWDGASRLIGAGGATLTYNGFGDLRTRSAGGQTIRYHYNRAINLSPIVAEQDEASGQFLRYYVWTPDGRLLYMIEASAGNRAYFFSFDRTGSTLALTDASGAVTDAYAYDPYGRLLGRTGSNPQPFTFVGQWGVRQEGTSGALYQMRARYYDAATGRFLSPDPVWPKPSDPRQLNPYQYAANDPIRNVDITGAQATTDRPAGGKTTEEVIEYVWTGYEVAHSIGTYEEVERWRQLLEQLIEDGGTPEQQTRYWQERIEYVWTGYEVAQSIGTYEEVERWRQRLEQLIEEKGTTEQREAYWAEQMEYLNDGIWLVEQLSEAEWLGKRETLRKRWRDASWNEIDPAIQPPGREGRFGPPTTR